MPSQALQTWTNQRLKELDQLEAAHQQVGGSGPGRRHATQQINHAYAVLLSSQFQGYCRDLHSEAIEQILRIVTPVSLQFILRTEFTLHRKLDQGNPIPGNIGADFNRLGLQFWPQVQARNPRNDGRRKQLEELNAWRNAIAHQHFDPAKLGGTINLRLATIKQWRRACHQLAVDFDAIIGQHLHQLTGISPW